MPKFKKIILLLILISLVSSVFSPAVKAAYVPGAGFGSRSNVVNKYKESLEAEGTNLYQWGIYAMNSIILGLTRLMVGVPELEGEQAIVQGGASGIFAYLISGMYENKPISSGRYLAYLKENLGIVRPAYAQGEGWKFLEPILPIWKKTRDITYLAFVIIFVAMGFMIMFRKKIDPQTAIGVQTALPKIILALLLVTFSYALCGLLVDLVFISKDLLYNAFNTVLGNIGGMTGGKGTYTGWIGKFYPITYTEQVAGVQHLLDAIFKALGGLIKIVGAVSGDFSGIFNLIIAFIFISSVIKIFFALLSKYVTIIMYAIFSPLILAWGSLPGQEDHLSRFFNSLLSAIITFPAVLFLLNIAAAIASASSALGLQPLPPFTAEFVEPSLTPIPGAGPGTPVLQTLAAFVSLGIIMATAKVPEAIDDALKVKPGAGMALGAEAMGVARKIPIIGSFVG